MRRGHRRDRVVRGIEARKRYIVVSFPTPCIERGISSVVERLLSMHEVVGSIPTFSTLFVASTHPALGSWSRLVGRDCRHYSCIEGYLEEKEPQGPQSYKATDNRCSDPVRAGILRNLVSKLARGRRHLESHLVKSTRLDVRRAYIPCLAINCAAAPRRYGYGA